MESVLHTQVSLVTHTPNNTLIKLFVFCNSDKQSNILLYWLQSQLASETGMYKVEESKKVSFIRHNFFVECLVSLRYLTEYTFIHST